MEISLFGVSKLGSPRNDDGDGSKTSLFKSLRVFSNFFAIIFIRLNVKCRKISPKLNSWGTEPKFRTRKLKSSWSTEVLHKTSHEEFHLIVV